VDLKTIAIVSALAIGCAFVCSKLAGAEEPKKAVVQEA